MNFKTETVQLTDINFSDKFYQITTNHLYEDLIQSIHKIGLIHPPILLEKDRSYSIISGFRRITACDHLGWKAIDVSCIDKEYSEADCVNLAIIENSAQRPLNLIELSRSINLLHSSISDENELIIRAKDVGIAENLKFIKKINRLCHMPESVQDGILNQSISLSVAIELEKLDQDEIAEFASIFNYLKVGLNIQREIMMHVQEIAKREDFTIMDVLSGEPIKTILKAEKIDRSIKIQRIRKYLKTRRYPELSQHEHKINQIVKSIKQYQEINFIPPKNFEGNEYHINIAFKNLEDLKNKNANLQKLIQSQELHSILK